MSVRMMLTYAFIGVNTCDRLSDSCCIQVLFISHFWHGDGHFSLGLSVAEEGVWLYLIVLLIRSVTAFKSTCKNSLRRACLCNSNGVDKNDYFYLRSVSQDRI